MTNQGRAEKIAKVLTSLLNYEPRLADSNYQAFIEELTSQFDEAYEFAWLKGFKDGDANGKAKGFASAKEKAAGIAETVDGWHPVGKQYANEIAERIRALRAEEK